MNYIIKIIIIITISLCGPFVISFSSVAQDSKKSWHTKNGFQNLQGAPERNVSFGVYFNFSLERMRDFDNDVIEIPENHIISEDRAIAGFITAGKNDSLTWIGHSTFLLQLDGKIILTDPFLSPRASPFSFLGPERYVPPGISINNLPSVDMILISHNHYDHLDKRTLEILPEKEKIVVVVPLGLRNFFTEIGYKLVYEIDWYEEIELNGIKFSSIPARHWSKRGFFDENRSLWMGAIIEGSEKRIYFSGDTAYAPYFSEIGDKYGPFDYGFVGIGAYEPREMMKYSHTTPEEAVDLAFDMGVRTVVAMHWGTIQLGAERPFEAPSRFSEQALKKGFKDEDIWIFAIGETRILD